MRKFEVVRKEFRKYPEVEIILPKKGSKNAMAYDFYSPIDIIVEPMKPTLIMTDVKAKMDTNEGLLLNVRSSMGKIPIIIACSQGWIDSDYYSNENNDGNIGVMLLNLSNEPYYIKTGDRIAQGMFIEYLPSGNGNTQEERIGGYGSTGK